MKKNEIIRKMLVSLKKNPQLIPLLALTISFLVFSLNLTSISETTARINTDNMGLCAFVSMLLSILSYVCMFSAYPKRQKPNKWMVLLMLLMYSIIIFADSYYLNRILMRTVDTNPARPNKDITAAQITMISHIVTTGITMACVVLEPVFAKMLKKVNTSVEIEANAEIDDIDISDED